MSFRFLDHTADIAVEVFGHSLEELFTSAACAWRESVIDLTQKGNDEKRIYLSESTLEELMVSFLDELNYLLYSKKWFFNIIRTITLETSQGRWNLNSLIAGDEIVNSNNFIKVEIKAITFHQMYIQKVNEQYTTRIIFDI